MTRKKAAELAESVHIDENVSQENEKDSAQEKVLMTPAPGDRPALGELAPNSADSKSADEGNGQELQKSTRGKKGTKKGGKKAKKADPAAIAAVDEEAQEEAPEDAADDNESMSSPASEEAAEEHFRGGSQGWSMMVGRSLGCCIADPFHRCRSDRCGGCQAPKPS